MKVTAYCSAGIRERTISLVPLSITDLFLFNNMFAKKYEKDARDGKNRSLIVTIELPSESKTFKQLATVFKLVTCIFCSQNGRNPTETEKHDLYLDLLEEYGDRVPSKIDCEKTRPVHLSDANTIEAAHFIEALLIHLANKSGLEPDIQADVRQILWQWETSRGQSETDPLDECSSGLQWRSRHNYSQASGLMGNIELAHIVSRGASEAAKFEAWNFLALTHDEHAELHKAGFAAFLRKYPHLENRVMRARKLAGKLEKVEK